MHGIVLDIFPYLEELLYGLPVLNKLYLLSGLLALIGQMGLLCLKRVLVSASHG
jgi:hypothetical protein